jgi:hypothetical protein
LTSSKDAGNSHDGGALAWSGDDPVTYTRAMAALEEADIRVFDFAEHDQFFTVPQISGPRYRVFIARSDAARAEKVIRETLGSDSKE